MVDLSQKISDEFRSRFSRDPKLVVAPGRINLIGEHVDYNDGFVMPAAVDKFLAFAILPNGTNRFNCYASDFQETVSFGMTDLHAGHHWGNYLMGVIEGFRQKGFALGGIDCVFGGTIPPGGGMSSSAALCCGFAFAVNHFFKCNLSRLELAQIAQFSEHNFAGVKCGLMDQYAVLFGEEDSLLLLDCRSMKHVPVPFPSAKCSIILVDTKVKHTLASSAYNKRRASCEEGVAVLKKLIPGTVSLRDVSAEQLLKHKDKLSAEVFIRCQYVTEEIARTQEAAQALNKGDLETFGSLMFLCHEGLSVKFEVSCPELDLLVDLAKQKPKQVIGSRLMGGGFGGCTVNLIRPGEEEAFETLISTEYFATFRITPEFYPVKLSQGTHLI